MYPEKPNDARLRVTIALGHLPGGFQRTEGRVLSLRARPSNDYVGLGSPLRKGNPARRSGPSEKDTRRERSAAAYSPWSPPDLFLSDYDVDPSFAGPRSLSFFSPGPLPFRYHASYLWLRDGVLFGDSGFFVGSGLP